MIRLEEEEKEADDCVPDLGGQSSLQRVAAAKVLSLLAGGKKKQLPNGGHAGEDDEEKSVCDCVGEKGALNGLGGEKKKNCFLSLHKKHVLRAILFWKIW